MKLLSRGDERLAVLGPRVLYISIREATEFKYLLNNGREPEAEAKFVALFASGKPHCPPDKHPLLDVLAGQDLIHCSQDFLTLNQRYRS